MLSSRLFHFGRGHVPAPAPRDRARGSHTLRGIALLLGAVGCHHAITAHAPAYEAPSGEVWVTPAEIQRMNLRVVAVRRTSGRPHHRSSPK